MNAIKQPTKKMMNVLVGVSVVHAINFTTKKLNHKKSERTLSKRRLSRQKSFRMNLSGYTAYAASNETKRL